MKTRLLMPVLLIWLFLPAATFFAQDHQAQTQRFDNLTPAQWRADLQFLAKELPARHKNAFHVITRGEFDVAVKNLDEKIPAMSREQIIVEMSRIVAMIGDGHTAMALLFDPAISFHFYPIRYYIFKDGLYVQAADNKYKEIAGGKVVKIGNLTAEEAVKKVGELIPHDNEFGVKNGVTEYLSVPEILQVSGIAKDSSGVSITVEKGGKQSLIQLQPDAKLANEFIHNHQVKEANWVDAREDSKNPTPLWLKDSMNLYWFEYITNEKTVYFQCNGIMNKPDEPFPAFLNRMFDFIKINDVEKLVIDLRLNGGGNNGLITPLIRKIIQTEKIDQRGKLFVVIGRRTFSAAQNAVNRIENYTNAIFVGEPSASFVNMYGDGKPFQLPNSKITVFAATVFWQDNPPADTRKRTAPEIYAEMTFEDYRNNQDPVIQSILKYVPGKSFKDIAAEALSANNLTIFSEKYRAFKADSANQFISTEADMNTLGYKLIEAKRVSDAVEIFKLNIAAYPNSVNGYDSLGEAYVLQGQREKAIQTYEKALLIDSNYQSSIDALKKLKGN